MNPDSPKTPREEMELRITALLLGELSAEEAGAVRELISHDRELTALHDRLKQAITLVREAAISPDQPVSGQAAPLKMSEERREKLLAHFKMVTPKEFVPEKRRAKFTFVELAAVIAILGVLAAISIPNFVHSRTTSQSNAIMNNLRQIDAAKQQWALEKNKSATDVPTMGELKPYLGRGGGELPPSVSGETYVVGKVADPVTAEMNAAPAKSWFSWLSGPPTLGKAGGQRVFLSSDGEQTFEEGKHQPLVVTTIPSAPAQAMANESLPRVLAPPTEQSLPPTPAVAGEFAQRLSRIVRRASTSGESDKVAETSRSATPPPAQIVLPSMALADAETGTSGTKVAADDSWLGVAGKPIVKADSGVSSAGTVPSKDGDHLYFATKQFERGLNTDPTTGLPVGTVVANGETPPTIPPATEPPAQRFSGGFGGSGGGGGGGFGGGGTGGGGVGSRSRVNFAAGSISSERGGSGETSANSRSFGIELPKESGVALQSFESDANGKRVAVLSDGRRVPAVQDRLGDEVPVLGDLPMTGRPFRSAANANTVVASNSQTVVEFAGYDSPGQFSLQAQSGRGISGSGAPLTAQLPLPRYRVREATPLAAPGQENALSVNGANTFVGGAVVNNGTFALGENRSKADGFNLNVAGIAEDQAVKVRDLAEQHSDRGKPQDVLADLQKTFDIKPDSKKVAMDVGGESSRRPRSSIVLPSSQSTPMIGQAATRVDPDTKTLTVVTDEETSQSIQQTLAALDEPTDGLLTSGLRAPTKVEPAHQSFDVPVSAGAPAKGVKSTDVAVNGVLQRQSSITLQKTPKELAQASVENRSASSVSRTNALLARTLRLPGANSAALPTQSLTENLEQADVSIRRQSINAPIPQPEIQTSENNFSTFSLNVSDVSFKLAAASLEKGQMPDPASIRSEEFINAFDYHDPEAMAGSPIAFAYERARYPFAHNRDLLRFSLKTAAAGRQAGRPLNIVLLLDNSGSMERADRVQIIREALRVLASQLQPQDKLSVITFARTARLFADGVSGDKADEIAEQVSGLTPEGGTNLEDAMNLAYQTAAKHYLANGINRVVLLTDGAANLGDVEPDSLKQKVEAQRKQGIALDCFGIGWEGFNDDLLEVLSRNGDGRYGFINSPEEAATDFVGQLAGALKVTASDVKVQVEFNPKRVTTYRQIGYAKHQLTKEQFRDNTVDAAEIAAQEAGNALYTVEINPTGEGPLCTVRVRYKIPGTTDYREQAWDVPYSGNALSLEQSSPAMRLAASASAFSEWLAVSPFAGEVTPDRVLGYLSGVPEIYGADARPKKLEWMIRQAKSVAGK